NAELNVIDASTLFIGDSSTGTITVTGPVDLNTSTAPTSLSLTTAPGNSIIVNGASPLSVPNGALTLSTGALTTSANVTAGGSMTLSADAMTFGGGPGSVSAGGTITLQHNASSTIIDIGGPDVPGPSLPTVLGLDSTDIAALSGGAVQIGNSSTLAINVT